jgi:hypothetical protein
MAAQAPSSHATQTSSPLHPAQIFTPNSPPDSRVPPLNMNNQNYPLLPSQAQNGGQGGARGLGEHRRTVSGSGNSNSGMTVPSGQLRQMNNGHPRNMSSIGPFDGPRSPPSNKSKKLDIVYRGTFTDETLWSDTSHVPCKFFRQGTCQAGKACPFSHATDNTTDLTPCKYFAKVAYSPLPSHTSTSSELLGNMDHFVLINLRETANLVPNVLWLIFYQTGAE